MVFQRQRSTFVQRLQRDTIVARECVSDAHAECLLHIIVPDICLPIRTSEHDAHLLSSVSLPQHSGQTGRTFHRGKFLIDDDVDHLQHVETVEHRSIGSSEIDDRVLVRRSGDLDDPSLWPVREQLWRDPRVVIGASDAGAHLDILSTYDYAATYLEL